MRRILIALGCLLASGCFFRGPGGGNNNNNSPDQIAADQAAYTQLAQQLDGNRTQFLGKGAMELYGTGKYVYWKTYPTFSPVLHRADDASGAALDYGFSIGGGDDNNYRASATMVVTAYNDGSNVRYLAYDAAAGNRALGEVDFAAPSDNQKWWAYAVDGNTLYVVTTGAATTLYRWTAGAAAATLVTTLESASGAVVGEFMDFDVAGDTLVYVESGRVWRMSLAGNSAAWLRNQTEVTGAINFGVDGILYEDASGLLFFEYASQTTRNLSTEIAGAGYQLSQTYQSAHLFYSATQYENYARWRDWVTYVANDGIFAYNLITRTVAPVLLSPIGGDVRIDYRYPVTLDDGALFVVGLTSTDGAVGADGPVYRVTLPATLR